MSAGAESSSRPLYLLDAVAVGPPALKGRVESARARQQPSLVYSLFLSHLLSVRRVWSGGLLFLFLAARVRKAAGRDTQGKAPL